MKNAITVLGLVLLMCSCVTTDEQKVPQAVSPSCRKQGSADSGRGIPYFSRYERNSTKPSTYDAPHLVDRKNGLPAFHDYERARKWTCLAAGTKIMTEEGAVVVEEVTVGTRLRAYDVGSGKPCSVAVTSVLCSSAEETIVVNGQLRLTERHPVFADSAWVLAGELRIGANLLTDSGLLVEVKSLKRAQGTVAVFDLSVETPHTFFADGYLVHNKTPDFRR